MKTLYRLKPPTKTLKNFYVFDTETRIWNKNKTKFKYSLRGRPENFAFGCIYGYNFTKVIHTIEEFKEEFKHERYHQNYLFAHNAEYDLNVLFSNIYVVDPGAIFNGRFIAARFGDAKFADSFNIYKYAAHKIGEFLGKPKLDLRLDKWRKEISSEDINYCIRDCEIIWDALFEIFNEVGDIKITQASLSMTYFRRYYQQYNISYNDHVKVFWSSYYGGRTEAFKIGNTHASVFDIKSSYPYAMVESKFPNPKYFRKLVGISPECAMRYIRAYEGCATIKVRHKDVTYGYLPFKSEGKLIFPVGVFEGTWNFNELRFALDHGVIEILEVKDLVYSEPMDSPFVDYINDQFDKRAVATSAIEVEWRKIFMNCLYGKFAQRIREEWKYIHSMTNQYDEIRDAIDKKIFIKVLPFNEERDDCFLVTKSMLEKTTSYSIPSFASYITSFGRIHLLKQLLMWEKYRPVYCDTDSVFCEIEPPCESTKKLGSWNKEDKIVTKVNGLKNYTYIKDSELKRRLKGVPMKAVEVSPNMYEYDTLVKTKEALRRGLEPGINIKRTKVISNKYDKRIVGPDGWTKPIEL